MTKFWNFFRNDAGERVLRLEGPIDSDNLWGDEITPKAFRAELEADEGDITVWINSPGGSVFSAAEIYTMLCDYKGKVTVKIDAIAASAASVVAMAGDKVLMSPVSMLMLHDPMTMAVGNAHDMEKVITTLNEIKESIINAYVKKTGLSRNKVSKLMSDETWLNAKKAVELGFADEILFTGTSEADDEPKEPDEPNNSSDEEGVTLEGGDESSGTNAKAVWTASWQPFSTRAMGEAIINRLIPHTVTDEAHTESAGDEPVLESGLTATAETAAQETQTQEEETSSELTNSEQATNSVEDTEDVVPEQTETPEATKPTEEPILETTNSEPAIKNDAVPEQKVEELISEQQTEPATKPAAPTKPTALTEPTEAVKNVVPEQQTEEKAPQEKTIRDEPDDLRIGLDGKAKDGSMPYVLLEKQLQLLQ